MSDPVLSAVRLVVEQGAPGLVIIDDHDRPVACVSSMDLLWLMLPPYLRGEQQLACTFGEVHADRIAKVLVGRTLADVVGELPDRDPSVSAEATIVELVEAMLRRSTSFLPIHGPEGLLGAVTANQVLGSLLQALGRADR